MEKKGKEINSWRKLRKKGDLKYKNFERKSGNLWYKNNEKKKKIKKLYEKGVLGIDAALYRLKFLYLNEYQKKKTCVVCTEWWTQPHVECISTRKSKR